MPKFSYTAVDSDGHRIKGTEKASDMRTARRALAERQLDDLAMSEKRSILHFEITRERVPRKELMHFSRQMAVFMRAGVPILDALTVINEEMPNKVFRRVLSDMMDRLQSGETFAAAASAHPEAFPPFYLGILRSSELTGNLDVVLDQLSEYIERDIDSRGKVISALIYPALVFLMAMITVGVLTAFVLPRFERFFKSLHAKLPLPTRMLLGFSHVLGSYWLLLLGGALVLVAAIVLGLRTDRGKSFRDRLLLRAPVLGDIVRHTLLERFCRILSTMVGAGVPLPDAMAVTADAANNVVYRDALFEARGAMMRGEGLADPLNRTGLFPGSARQMFRVGEQTGTLDEQLHTAAVFFDRELEYKLKRFTSLFEPAIIVVMGLIVGFVAVALVTAMYGIFRQVKV